MENQAEVRLVRTLSLYLARPILGGYSQPNTKTVNPMQNNRH